MSRNFRFKYRILSLAAALILIFSSVPAASAATGGKCGDHLYWSYDKNVLTISGTGEMYDFLQKTSQNRPGEPPWRLYDTSVAKIVIEEGCESIGDYAFYAFSPLTSVVLPENSLKKIGTFSFSRCSLLPSVRIPDSVVSIGKDAFSSCTSLRKLDFGSSPAPVPQNMCAGNTSLNDVRMSPNCREVRSYAFSSCSSLREIDLSRVERIESLSFQNCPLASVSFGKDLKNMETNAFYGCSSLSEVIFDEETYPESVSNLFLNQTPYYSALPSGLYTMFGGKVLMHKGTYTGTSLTVEEGIEVIADGAFDGASKLTSVTLPSTLRAIGAYAFRDCKKLSSVSVPRSVKRLGANCLGKFTENMSYVNLDGFTLSSKGCAAALEYASEEALAYVCEHDFEYVEERGSCDAPGSIKKVCRWCGACTEKTATLPAEHDFETVAIAAGCDSEDFTLRRCKICGAEEKTDAIPPLGHARSGEWTVVSLPSCSAPGEVSVLCERCGEALDTVYLEMTAHTASAVFETETSPSCVKGGTEVKRCRVCGEVLERRNTVAAGHIPDDERIALTLPSEDGKLCGCTATVCSVCREILSVEWTDAEGNEDPHGAANAHAAARSVILCEADRDVASIDFNADGKFNAKDLVTLASLAG